MAYLANRGRTTAHGRPGPRLPEASPAIRRPRSTADGRIEVFARGTDDALWHIWQTVPHAGPWSAWASLAGGLTSDAVVSLNSDGRLEAFARGTDFALWNIWQTALHAGPWSAWSSLGGILIYLVVYLGLNEQYQQQSEWCWLATTVSITLYYDPASTWTQCLLANKELGQTTCCVNGSSTACNVPGYPILALTTTGHFASMLLKPPPLQTIMNEIEAGHPVSINIQWFGGGGHNRRRTATTTRTPRRRPSISRSHDTVRQPWTSALSRPAITAVQRGTRPILPIRLREMAMPLHYATAPTNGTALVQKGLSRVAARTSPLSDRGIDLSALQVSTAPRRLRSARRHRRPRRLPGICSRFELPVSRRSGWREHCRCRGTR